MKRDAPGLESSGNAQGRCFSATTLSWTCMLPFSPKTWPTLWSAGLLKKPVVIDLADLADKLADGETRLGGMEAVVMDLDPFAGNAVATPLDAAAFEAAVHVERIARSSVRRRCCCGPHNSCKAPGASDRMPGIVKRLASTRASQASPTLTR